MGYERINWKNSLDTPINADNLNKMDAGIYNIDQSFGEIINNLNNGLLKNSDGRYGARFYGNGLNLSITPFKAAIYGKLHELSADYILPLATKKASLIYAQKQASIESSVPIFGALGATFPEVQTGKTGLRYTFEEETPQDSSGNNNHIQIINECELVDGYCGGNAIKFNGTSSYMTSTSASGLIAGGGTREMRILYIPLSIAGTQCIAAYGATSGTEANCFKLLLIDGFVVFSNNQTNYNSGVKLEIGKAYLLVVQYDGTRVYIAINGAYANSFGVSLNTGTSVLYLGRNCTAAEQYAKGIIQYFEMLNTPESQKAMAITANKFLLPCDYIEWTGAHPNITTENSHYYKFDDTDTNVTDEFKTLSGSATGTSIVDSEITDWGKARKFNGTASDYIAFGNYAFTSAYSIIWVGTIRDYSAVRPLISNRVSGSGGNILYVDTDGLLKLNNSTDTVTSDRKVPCGIPIVIICTITRDLIRFYINKDIPEIHSGIELSTNSNQLFFGKDYTNNFFAGTMEAVGLIPAELTEAECSQIMQSILIANDRGINDELPAESIKLGYVWTGADKLKYISYDYKYRDEPSLYDNMFPGDIRQYPGQDLPKRCAWCAVSLSRYNYYRLFELIGDIFGGGDGYTTFNTPDMRGRTAIGLDNMGGVSADRVANEQADILGGSGGEEKHALTGNENGPHAHANQLRVGVTAGSTSGLTINQLQTSSSLSYINNASSGNGEPHNNMQPWLGFNFIIKY